MPEQPAEFSMIQQFFSRHCSTAELHGQPAHKALDLGVGDDAALLLPPQGQQLVSCVDTLVAGRHFPLDTDPYAIGWKSVAVNLSDLAAMSARPHSILLALSLPEVQLDWLQRFSDGLYACCDAFGVQLIGGDTTQSPTLSISITALGFVPTGQAVLRSGAQVGDVIVVSGTMGDAAYALTQLASQPQHPLRARLDYPSPRCALGQQLAGLASSMIDISDGLAQDLQHILTASKVGARLDVSQLPLSPAVQALPKNNAWQHALCGGDDYELCFTIARNDLPRLHALQAELQPVLQLSVIGEITATRGLTLLDQGQPLEATQHAALLQGYQHFV